MNNFAARNIGTPDVPQPVQAASSQIDGSLHVERLMALAFFPGRAPRSAEYRQGCQAALEYRILGRRMPPGYAPGCCEADAWFAGAEEGRAIWRRKCETAAKPTSTKVPS
ncbi:MAG: hypothetical protein M3Y65_10555 [Pseudomonadota bacterium]|nr:hypothetical protein [Pseudomonadota bacterium]